jgi:hypothetical protein
MVQSAMGMGIWQGVAMDSLKFHPGPLCRTLLRPAGGIPPKRPTGQVACSHLLPFWTPHAVRLCYAMEEDFASRRDALWDDVL